MDSLKVLDPEGPIREADIVTLLPQLRDSATCTSRIRFPTGVGRLSMKAWKVSSASQWWRPASIVPIRRARRNQRIAYSQNSPAGCATMAVAPLTRAAHRSPTPRARPGAGAYDTRSSFSFASMKSTSFGLVPGPQRSGPRLRERGQDWRSAYVPPRTRYPPAENTDQSGQA